MPSTSSRERVFKALEFSKPDRAPRNLWCTYWVGMFAAEQQKELQHEFPDDFCGPGEILGKSEKAQGKIGYKGTYVDEWGCVWECAEDGVVGEVKGPPLTDWSGLTKLKPPVEIIEKADWDLLNRTQEANLNSSNPKFMIGGTTIRPFERMQFLRGSENLYMDLGLMDSSVLKLRDMLHEFFMDELSCWVKTDCDGLGFMDDWGSQNSLLISPDLWQRVFKPLYKDYCDLIHSAGKKVFFHSDGHITSIYEHLVDIGVDAINSQLFCMDINELARQFKGQITFWGEIDRQNILPFGTTEDVRNAVRSVRSAFDDGNGGVIAQCEWGAQVPIDNIRTVFETWDE